MDLVFFFLIRSRVLQGFPCSGTQFVLGIGPLLWSLRDELSAAVVCMCVDSVSMASVRLEQFALLCKVFGDCEAATDLCLKPVKFILLPALSELSNWNFDMGRAWWRRFTSDWAGLLLKAAAEYLGLHFGPAAGSFQRIAAAKKYADRLISI